MLFLEGFLLTKSSLPSDESERGGGHGPMSFFQSCSGKMAPSAKCSSINGRVMFGESWKAGRVGLVWWNKRPFTSRTVFLLFNSQGYGYHWRKLWPNLFEDYYLWNESKEKDHKVAEPEKTYDAICSISVVMKVVGSVLWFSRCCIRTIK